MFNIEHPLELSEVCESLALAWIGSFTPKLSQEDAQLENC